MAYDISGGQLNFDPRVAQAAIARQRQQYQNAGYQVGGSGANISLTGGTAPTYNLGGSSNFNQYLKEQGLPDWGATQSNYEQLRQQAPTLFDYSGYMNAASGLGNQLMAQGLNAANSVARQYTSQAQRAGVTPYGAGIARAQALIPAQAEARRLGLDAEAFKATQMAGLANYNQTLASQQGQLQQAYQNNLAGYNQGVMGIQSRNYQWQQEFSEDQRRYNEAQRMARANAAGNAQAAQAPRSTGGMKGNFFQGYIPNSGPIRPATLNGQKLFGDTVFYSAPTVQDWSMLAR